MSSFGFLDLRHVGDPLAAQRYRICSLPDYHPEKAAYLLDLSGAFFMRFRSLGRPGDIEEAIALSHRALDIMPDSHPQKAGVMSNLATFLTSRGQPGDVENALTMHRRVVSLTPDGRPDKPVSLHALGNALLSLYNTCDRRSDLDEAIEVHRRSVALAHDDHPNKPAFLNNLGYGLFARYTCTHELTDVEEGVPALRSAVALAAVDDPNIAEYFTTFGLLLHARFQCLGNVSDVEEALAAHRQALRLTPDGHPHLSRLLRLLGDCCLALYKRCRVVEHLVEAVTWHRCAVELAADVDSKKSELWCTLGEEFQLLFEARGQECIGDVEEAISAYSHAVKLTSDGHPARCDRLRQLGDCFSVRFKRLHDVQDLTDSITAHRSAIMLMSEDHPLRPKYIGILGFSLQTRFDQLGELDDLRDALSNSRRALQLSPDSVIYLMNVGKALCSLSERLREPSDLDEAITMFERARSLVAEGHPHVHNVLTNLVSALRRRFNRTHSQDDLDLAIRTQRDIVQLHPDDHSEMPQSLHVLGVLLTYRFRDRHDPSDIDEAITLHRCALELLSVGDPDRVDLLAGLGHSLLERVQRCGELADIDEAVSTFRQVIAVVPDEHKDHPEHLQGLALSLRKRYEHSSDLRDIDEAIATNRRALGLTSESDLLGSSELGASLMRRFEGVGDLRDIDEAISQSRRASEAASLESGHELGVCLCDLGTFLWARFQRSGDIGDIQDAIKAILKGIAQLPADFHTLAMFYSSLGNCFSARFQRLGESSDIDEAIAAKRKAVQLRPEDHSEMPMYLSNLGTSLIRRFERFGELSDLDEAIVMHRRAVDLTVEGHRERAMFLNNLGSSHMSRFHVRDDLKDVSDAIVAHRQAVELTPDGDYNKLMHLSCLGDSYRTRFVRFGESSGSDDASDIDKAIEACSRAVDLTPDGHYDAPTYYSGLGQCFTNRYDRFGDDADFAKAVTAHRRAIDIIPDGHTSKLVCALRLAGTMQGRIKWTHSLSDIAEALDAARLAANTAGAPSLMLKAAMHCTQLYSHRGLFTVQPEEAIQMHAHVMDLIPQVVWLGHGILRRYEEISGLGDAVTAAVATALWLGDKSRASQWFEQGRALVWGQIQNLRTPMHDLRLKHPVHAEKLRLASAALESAGQRPSTEFTPLTPAAQRGSLEEEVVTHRRVAREYQQLLDEIRQLDGFHHFPRPRQWDDLCHSASDGPVVCVNVHESRCDALIICNFALHQVHLPELSPALAAKWHRELNKYLAVERARKSKPYKPPTGGDGDLRIVLRSLWSSVVHPVIAKLPETPAQMPRITWCTTGALAFLPLHAAGPYDSPSSLSAFDLVTTSYTPTLASLLSGAQASDAIKPSILVVAQPNTPDLSRLPGTVKESELVRDRFTSEFGAQTLIGVEGTVDAVLKHMEHHPYVHLACHGTQAVGDPTQSAFLLQDGRLTLQKLMTSSLSAARLAFLSACETAVGDEKMPDEVVHLAAGMLAVGYRSVVATMWCIGDNEAPLVADAFYKTLLEDRADNARPMDVAQALHAAVRVLRDKVGEGAFVKWVPFVHFGV
ncbi:TPR-like protein, partial [Exidia glandulosa HHB12029]